MKKCSMCKQEHPLDFFYVGRRRGSTYIYSRCRGCCKILNDSYKDRGRDWELTRKYGITLEEYKNQSNIRNNYCDICDHQTKVLHVDHNHVTNKVRGYLCGSCNRGIGLLKDSAQVCYNAALYLKGHNDKETLSDPGSANTPGG